MGQPFHDDEYGRSDTIRKMIGSIESQASGATNPRMNDCTRPKSAYSAAILVSHLFVLKSREHLSDKESVPEVAVPWTKPIKTRYDRSNLISTDISHADIGGIGTNP